MEYHEFCGKPIGDFVQLWNNQVADELNTNLVNANRLYNIYNE